MEVVKKYEKILPQELIHMWELFGWGTYMNGFLRIINPIDWEFFTHKHINLVTPSIPFAITAFGDILLWLSDGYIETVSFRKGYREVIESGMELFFNDTLTDIVYCLEELKSTQFMEAKTRLGVPAYDQCYGYVPLLALGGAEQVENIQILDLQTHLELMAQVVGPL